MEGGGRGGRLNQLVTEHFRLPRAIGGHRSRPGTSRCPSTRLAWCSWQAAGTVRSSARHAENGEILSSISNSQRVTRTRKTDPDKKEAHAVVDDHHHHSVGGGGWRGHGLERRPTAFTASGGGYRLCWRSAEGPPQEVATRLHPARVDSGPMVPEKSLEASVSCCHAVPGFFPAPPPSRQTPDGQGYLTDPSAFQQVDRLCSGDLPRHPFRLGHTSAKEGTQGVDMNEFFGIGIFSFLGGSRVADRRAVAGCGRRKSQQGRSGAQGGGSPGQRKVTASGGTGSARQSGEALEQTCFHADSRGSRITAGDYRGILPRSDNASCVTNSRQKQRGRS